MSRRHIAVLTGKRGGYGAMKPMLRAIDTDPLLRLSLIVTDQHVNPRFGATATEVARDFRIAAAVDMEQEDGSPVARARALGLCLNRMSDVLNELRPDILVLYGDRGEVLATAITAIHLGIPIAHLQGGDLSGNVDELMRHAMTKLSHLHFPSTAESAERIRRMGEEEWRIHVAGDNHVDPIVAGNYSDEPTIRQRYGIAEGEKPIVVLQHPETTRRRDHYADMRAILDAILKCDRRTIIVYPCSDQGYDEIVRAIREVESHPGVSVHQNIDAPDFWGLLAIAGAMVGNSSAGLIETPYFKLPAINVGQRQLGRLHAENVIHCNADRHSVADALATAMEDTGFRERVAHCSRPFGDGLAWQRVVEVLRTAAIGPDLLNKRMTY
ncbi:MAG: UDP-N-acetylglucosamine 2-epimerase [Sulfuritalea sp.]|nr:UDP-N-acetylglucosamine 2-epimerase [Sulfuritalea sp.]